MTEPLQVSIQGVAKRFGSRQVLDGIDMTIQPGQTAALIGPSGGGKSTLLRCINGLTPFDAGEIRVGPHQLVAGPFDEATDPVAAPDGRGQHGDSRRSGDWVVQAW